MMSFWLPELIDGAARGASATVDATIDAIDEAARGAARTMLDALLPAIIRSQYLAVQAGSRLSTEGRAVAIATTLGSADVSMALAGAVEEKVTAGLQRMASNRGYARGVESIRP